MVPTVTPMDRQKAMLELPMAYAVALRMQEAGADAADIGRALEVPEEAVPELLAIGASKLAALLDDPGGRWADTG